MVDHLHDAFAHAVREPVIDAGDSEERAGEKAVDAAADDRPRIAVLCADQDAADQNEQPDSAADDMRDYIEQLLAAGVIRQDALSEYLC